MNPILLDAGVIVALLDRSERYHSQCIEVLSDLTGTLVTCEAAIAEACYKKYRDVPMDLADACLVDLADRLDAAR
jgi:predicted nucleic acid-binding protein